MKHQQGVLAAVGIGLLILGALLAYFPSRGYTQRHVVAAASACHVDMNIIQAGGATPPERILRRLCRRIWPSISTGAA